MSNFPVNDDNNVDNINLLGDKIHLHCLVITFLLFDKFAIDGVIDTCTYTDSTAAPAFAAVHIACPVPIVTAKVSGRNHILLFIIALNTITTFPHALLESSQIIVL